MKNNTDWRAILRSLGHGKQISKELARHFKENQKWALLKQTDFQDLFQDIVIVDDDACGSGCCQDQNIVGPNGSVNFYLGFDAGWTMYEGYLEYDHVRLIFKSYSEWLSCYRRILKEKRRRAKKMYNSVASRGFSPEMLISAHAENARSSERPLLGEADRPN
jgi:hypothetical protein